MRNLNAPKTDVESSSEYSESDIIINGSRNVMFPELQRHGVDAQQMHSKLTESVGVKMADEFMKGFEKSLKRPDQELIQGGTANCWFMGRIGQIAASEPERFAQLIQAAVLNGELNNPDLFKEDSQKLVAKGFGKRPTFSRAIQEWYNDRFGVKEGDIHTEELIQRSEEFLNGGKAVTLVATSEYSSSGADPEAILKDPRLYTNAGVVLEWARGVDSKTGEEIHGYHMAVIVKIEGGRVYVREGLKSSKIMDNTTGTLHTYPNGEKLVSFEEKDFASRCVGFYIQKDVLAAYNSSVDESKIIRPSSYGSSVVVDSAISFDPSLLVMPRKSSSLLEDSIDFYGKYLKSKAK